MPQLVVQPWMLESAGVIAAPSPELLGIRELDGLHGLKSVSGNFLSLDIESSREALKEESQRTLATLGAQGATPRS